VFLDADIAGLLATSKLGAATLTTGYFRVKTDSSLYIPAWTSQTTATTSYNNNTSQLGHNNADVFILDGKYAISKNLNVGGAYYLLSDYSSASPITVHVISANADAKIGPATVSGFIAAETGYAYDANTVAQRVSVSAYAANVAAKMAIGPGTLKTSGLFLSGDGDAKSGNNTGWTTSGVNTYAEGGMFLLFRTGVGGTTNDRTISGGNFTTKSGFILYTLGYDATITPKLYTNVNAGMLWLAKSNYGPKPANGGDMLGTEVNLETGYKLYDNLTAKVQVAYVVLGGAYKNSTADGKNPENPYTGRVGLSYAF
jgi:hypothetical protein